MSKPLRALIIEDNENDVLLLARELKRSGWDLTYDCTDTPEGMQQLLEEKRWDVIISDYSMPRFSGVDALRIAQKRCLDMPFIIVSGTIGEQTAVNAMRAGAHDYIMKNHLGLLSAAIERELREASMRQKHRRAEERFRLVSRIATDVIYEWDLLNGSIEWFGQFNETLGYEPNEVPHTMGAWLELIHPEDRDRVREGKSGPQPAGDPVQLEYRIQKKDGSWRYWLDRGAPEYDDQGRAIKWVGGCTDVTRQKEAETRLVDYQGRLKKLASELSLAEERERRRIAVGVHDDICQKLALAKLELQSFQHKLKDAESIKAIERECCIIDQIISDAHSLTFELSNPILYEIGLDGAIDSWLSANIQGKHGVTYTFKTHERGLKPPEDVRVFLFHSVRELVTNIIKHAQAHTITVSIEGATDGLCVTVADDGLGFDLNSVQTNKAGGFGLFSVEERLAFLGGRFSIQTAPGQGTCIKLVVPWHG